MAERNIEKIKYTFLLPAYKVRFLAEALNSLKKQTYHNFKVVVSDDCSPENLKSIFDSVVGSDSRFVYRRNEKNIGGRSLVTHWNLLVNLCDTEFLIMASDDDVYEPDFLYEIDGLTKKYSKVDLLRARSMRTENGIVVRKDFNLDEFMSYAQFLSTFNRPDIVTCLANYVFRTNKLRELGGFPDFPTAAKSDAAAAMMMSKNGVALTKDILFTFRISNENLSSASGYDDNCERTLLANLMFQDWYQKNIRRTLKDDVPDETYLLPLIDLAHKHHVEDISLYLLSHLSLKKCYHYIKEFQKRGFLTDKTQILTLLKLQLTNK